MIKINMFSSADKIKGQGVGSAYNELVAMLRKHFSTEFMIEINDYKPSDISHYHTVDPWFLFSTFFRKKRGKTVGYVHFLPDTLEGSIDLFGPFQKIFNWYITAFYKRMDQLVVVNPCFIPELEKFGIPKEKVTYIPNFVSKEVFYEKSVEENEIFRQAQGYQKEDFIVLGAGQIQQRKGVDDFFRLAEENPEIQFIWAGGFSFGKITDGYEKYKKVYENPPANLRFTGIIDRSELTHFYNMADLFLLPSYNELFPMSILEAFNCGTPVMLRDLELYRAIIEGDYLCAKDVDEMKTLIKDSKENPDMLVTYEEKSRKAANYYSEEHVAAIWFEYYTKMVQPKAQAKYETD